MKKSEMEQRIQYLERRYNEMLEMEQRMKERLAIHREKIEEQIRNLYLTIGFTILFAGIFALIEVARG